MNIYLPVCPFCCHDCCVQGSGALKEYSTVMHLLYSITDFQTSQKFIYGNR